MQTVNEERALSEVRRALADLIDQPVEAARLTKGDERARPDALYNVGDYQFVVEWKGSGASAPVALAVDQVRSYASMMRGKAIPLVAVPYMSSGGREICERAGIGWIDLSGNARIVAPGLRVQVTGEPNRFIRPGRKASAFAPVASRVARWLLINTGREASQREIAEAVNLSEGYVSRIVARLLHDGLVTKDESGRIQTRDPNLLLDAWREDYQFERHHIVRGHIAMRSGSEVLRHLAGILDAHGIRYAATGLAAAWLFTHQVSFRLVTIYVEQPPRAELLHQALFRAEPRGANLWLVLPKDLGVFDGAQAHSGIQCVHPVQAYLDLKGHPERAGEAAAELRRLLPSPDARA